MKMNFPRAGAAVKVVNQKGQVYETEIYRDRKGDTVEVWEDLALYIGGERKTVTVPAKAVIARRIPKDNTEYTNRWEPIM
jgi:uncharacterized protein YmfQ (DUF2313 family)